MPKNSGLGLHTHALPFTYCCPAEQPAWRVPPQVEGLCALVSGVKELVAKAEQVTTAEFVRSLTHLLCMPCLLLLTCYSQKSNVGSSSLYLSLGSADLRVQLHVPSASGRRHLDW